MGTVDFDGRDAIAYWLRRDLNEANARVAAMQGEREAANDLIAALQAELAALRQDHDLAVWDINRMAANMDAAQAELAALRPWADVGKRMMREGWWIDRNGYLYRCTGCGIKLLYNAVHPADTVCDIPGLLAQLEADDE